MKLYSLIFLAMFLLFQGCNGKIPSPKKALYNNDFKWAITIPENFASVSALDWAKMQNKGADAVEKTYDLEVENRTKIIFVFKNDQLNYFESNFQPFDTILDGNYLETCKGVNEMLYETFKAQMPGTKVDTIASKEFIDNLEFQKFSIKITYPNQMILNVLMYSRLFDKREFTVNIMFIDKSKGEAMLSAWKNSKFEK